MGLKSRTKQARWQAKAQFLFKAVEKHHGFTSPEHAREARTDIDRYIEDKQLHVLVARLRQNNSK